MKDFRDGRVRRDYASGLAEMKDSLEFMVQLAAGAQEAVQKRNPVPRERDGGAASEQLGESVAALGKELSKPDRSQPGGSADFSAGAHVGDLVVEEESLNFDKDDVAVDASMFRADIRGVVDRTLTVSAVHQIGRAVGSETLQRRTQYRGGRS
jgi:hypothetical protein